MKKSYQQLIDSGQLSIDSAQLIAIEALSDLTQQLVLKTKQLDVGNSKFKQDKSTIRQKLTQRLGAKEKSISGIYFHGRVGRGKTMLMDLFYQNLPIEKKQRLHFHRFMETVNKQLNQLAIRRSTGMVESHVANTADDFPLDIPLDNPLTTIAKLWASKVEVLCFDEFFISDIANAMVIGGLLEAFFEQGITLIATSNCQPEALFNNGLPQQRERFLPTIDLINQYCHVISVDGDIDHRRTGVGSQLSDLSEINDLQNQAAPYQYYAFPIVQYPYFIHRFYSELVLKKSVADTTNDNHITGKLEKKIISINGRDLIYQGKDKSCIWFDFFDLCSGPRSQRDYMALADQFSVVFISNVPKFSGELVPAVFSGVEDNYQRSGVLLGNLRQLDDEARRFMALVDEFYDQKISLVISAEVDIADLYQGEQLSVEFARCQSRLFEMQTWKLNA